MIRVVSHVYTKGPRNYNIVLSLLSKWGAGVSLFVLGGTTGCFKAVLFFNPRCTTERVREANEFLMWLIGVLQLDYQWEQLTTTDS